MMGQGSYIKTSSGKAARKPNAHRSLAAMTRQILKGMSVATTVSGKVFRSYKAGKKVDLEGRQILLTWYDL